jgi:hypothetical protein
MTGDMLPDEKKNTPIAVFSGRSIRARVGDGRRARLSTLEVYPQAHKDPVLNYIVLGALLIERRRLAPYNDDKGLFSADLLEKSPWKKPIY